MKRTDSFFLIHNYNTVPSYLVEMCNDYLICDCSDQEGVKEELDRLKLNVKDIPNTGHNITSYFSYFDEMYDNLPEVICLLKGNIVPRHLSKDYFDKVYDNKYFTFLYDEKQYWDRYSKFTGDGKKVEESNGTFLAMENVYVEENTSWYVKSENHPNRYFDDTDDLLRFIYKDPMVPRYYMFAPGACYIVRKEQILKHSRIFYRNLNKLMDYGVAPHFPSEAHMVERILPIIFTSICETNEWMDREELFDEKLPECSEYIRYKFENRPRRFKKIRKMLGLI